MLHRLFTLLFTTIAGTLVAVAQDVTVEASLDANTILIGQQVKMKTVVTCEKGAKVEFPDFSNGEHTKDRVSYIIPGVELADNEMKTDTTAIDGGKRWQLKRDYLITSFDSATYTLPQFQVKVNDSIYLSDNELTLTVNTLDITDDDLAKPRPPMAPVDAVFKWTPRIVAWCLIPIIALFLIVIMAVHACNKQPFIRRIKVRPPTPPQVAAFAGLDRLRKRSVVEDEQKAFYTDLTDVLRSYVADRYGFNAREMTTEEIIAHLQESADTTALAELKSVLLTADLVKFAKYRATAAETTRNLNQTADYVEATKVEPSADEAPVEKIVVVGDIADRRVKRCMYAAIGALSVGGLAAFGYVVYLLWESFL